MSKDLKPKVIGVEDGEAVLKPLETAAPIEDPTKVKVVQPVQHLQPSQPLPAKTTEQEDITKAGQREINRIWEDTQSQIAKVSVYSGLGINIIAIVVLLFAGRDMNPQTITVILACLLTVNTTMGMIIGFYFSRTNHTAIGGTGEKDKQTDFGKR